MRTAGWWLHYRAPTPIDQQTVIWNYLIRRYRPRAEILNGSWTFPAIEPSS